MCAVRPSARCIDGVYEALCAGGVVDYPRARLTEDVGIALIFRLTMWVRRSALLEDPVEGRQRRLLDDAFERGQLFAALIDHPVAQLLPGPSA